MRGLRTPTILKLDPHVAAAAAAAAAAFCCFDFHLRILRSARSPLLSKRRAQRKSSSGNCTTKARRTLSRWHHAQRSLSEQASGICIRGWHAHTDANLSINFHIKTLAPDDT
eukprot:COSAG01_NODE_23430_length_815_cov_1.793296_1_plen_111_part_10